MSPGGSTRVTAPPPPLVTPQLGVTTTAELSGRPGGAQHGLLLLQSSLAAGAIRVDAAPSHALLLSRDRIHNLTNARYSFGKRRRALALKGSSDQARQISDAVMG